MNNVMCYTAHWHMWTWAVGLNCVCTNLLLLILHAKFNINETFFNLGKCYANGLVYNKRFYSYSKHWVFRAKNWNSARLVLYFARIVVVYFEM